MDLQVHRRMPDGAGAFRPLNPDLEKGPASAAGTTFDQIRRMPHPKRVIRF